MKEKDFGKEVLDRLKADKKLNDWYEKRLTGKGFEKTIETIAFSDEINPEQKVVLSLFIGLSTSLVMEAKKALEAFSEFKKVMGITD